MVLVESPIDAMSVAVMERTDSKKTLYLSTDGAGQLPLEFLRFVKEVAIAYDNDDAGELMAQRVKSQLPEAVRKTPKAVDWNQDLVNTFDWSSLSRSDGMQRHPRQERKRDRGFKP
ncbi:MAG: toprim domain-containing protein [Waterburya sp.]